MASLLREGTLSKKVCFNRTSRENGGGLLVPDFDVIADVSTTLELLLKNALDPSATAQIHDLQGQIIGANEAKLTIFLYEVIEDPSARNRPRLRGSSPPNILIQKPPVALSLHYLLTPWGGTRDTEHKILGRAIQILYDNAILSGTALQGGLANTDQALKITQIPLALEELTRVWYSVQKPYHLSICYEVRVVNLDSKQEEFVRSVAQRTLDYVLPEGVAP
jgi:hypothetical protein